MRILLVHYRYFLSGGPERYLFNVKRLLESQGHEVIPFSVQNERNVESPYSSYFLSPIGTGREVYFRDVPKTSRNVLKMLGRNYYSLEAKHALERLLDDHPVDVAYVLHYLRWMSPSVLDVLYARGIPIVVRLSDYKLLCPQSHFLRDGVPCELCKTGDLSPALRYRCVQGSLPATLVEITSRLAHRVLRADDHIRRFVAPSAFLKQKLIEGGYEPGRIEHVPTFIDASQFRPQFSGGRYILYFGRLSPEKGIDVLLDAWRMVRERRANAELRIVGGWDAGQPAANWADAPGVTRFDAVDGEALHDLVRGAIAVVSPNICYENMPNSVLESFALGKPVIGSNIGAIPELVRDGETGYLSQPGSASELAKHIIGVLDDSDIVEAMGKRARAIVEVEHSAAQHYERLMNVFSSC
jgi:glycosyltransferase involved in cell wall biosynthesis